MVRITRAIVSVATALYFIFAADQSIFAEMANLSVISPDAQIPSTQPAEAVQGDRRRHTAPVEALVRDPRGNPLQGIGVLMHDLERDKIVRAVTNNQGKAVFECLAFGSYRMEVESLHTYMHAWQGGALTFVHDREGRQVRWTASMVTSAVAQLARGGFGCPCDEESDEERPSQANATPQHAQRGAAQNVGEDATPDPKVSQALFGAANRAANIETFVIDAQDQPLVGVEVTIRDEDGWIVAQEKTDERGAVTVKCLELGKYTMDIAPHTDRWQGGSTSFTLDQEGQAVQWLTSRVLPAVSQFGAGGGLCVCTGGSRGQKNPL